MNEQTFQRRFNDFVTELNNHPNKSELLNIMIQQLNDDTVIIDT